MLRGFNEGTGESCVLVDGFGSVVREPLQCVSLPQAVRLWQASTVIIPLVMQKVDSVPFLPFSGSPDTPDL